MKKVIDFSKYSTFKIGPRIEVEVIEDITSLPKEYFLIGGASNVLIGNNPPPLAILSKKFDYIKIEDGILKIGGATPNGKIASFCKKNDIANFEYISHLPGRLGGAVKMNAGLKEYETFNHLLYIKTDKGIFEKKEIDFGYRYTKLDGIVFEAGFELKKGFSPKMVEMFKNLRANQPSNPSAGSCFKNPPNDYAGRLIEEVGLKGIKKGDIAFSKIHANFLVNLGNGVFEDAVFLINEAKNREYQEFGIKLALEIIILNKGY